MSDEVVNKGKDQKLDEALTAKSENIGEISENPASGSDDGMINLTAAQDISADKKDDSVKNSDIDQKDAEASVKDSGANTGIEVLKAENSQLKEAALRAQAEMQNVRRRAEKDVEKARKYALEKFVNELLPVADNLERALDVAGAIELTEANDAKHGDQKSAQESFIEGVELTLKALNDTLSKFGVESVDPQDEPFDPQLHQAMSMVPNPNVEPNTVINVFQKGYTLNGRLVRPAMVVVSQAPTEA